MRPATCLPLLALALATAGAPARTTAEPTPPHGEGVGKVVYGSTLTVTKQTMKVQGQDIAQNQTQTFYHRWTDLGPDGDGNRRYKYRIEGVKMSIDIAGNKIEYDSTKDPEPGAAASPLNGFFAALVGAELVAVIDTDTWEVLRVEGREALLKKLTNANPAIKTTLEAVLSEEAVKEMVHPAAGVKVPAGAKKGTTWTDRRLLKLGPIGTYQAKNTYTVAGPDPRGERYLLIDVAPELTYRPPAKKEAGGLPFRITAADLKTRESSGRVLYDPTTRRVIRSETAVKLAGTLTVEIGNQETTVELDQDQKTVTEFATKPILP